jgi:hypothetical protein
LAEANPGSRRPFPTIEKAGPGQDYDAKVDSQHAEGVREGIYRHEMRLLDWQHGKSIQRCCQQRCFGVEQAQRDQKDQQDGKNIRQRGKLPTHDGNRVVTHLPYPLADVADDEQGQRAVNKEVVTDITWIQCGSIRVKVLAHGLYRCHAVQTWKGSVHPDADGALHPNPLRWCGDTRPRR